MKRQQLWRGSACGARQLALTACAVIGLSVQSARATAPNFSVTVTELVTGCNQTSTTLPRKGELVRVHLVVTNNEDHAYKDVRTELVCNSGPATCGNPAASPATNISVAAETLNSLASADSWHYFVVDPSTPCDSGSNQIDVRVRVYYVDTDTGSPDTDVVQIDPANITACSTLSAPSAVTDPGEVCCTMYTEVSGGIKYEWEHVSNGDRYNGYRGLIPINNDSTNSPGPKPRYNHLAIPSTTEVQGFCTAQGLNSGSPFSGDLSCSGCSDIETGHREITDVDEPTVPSPYTDFYYLISAENDCLVAAKGREGTLGYASGPVERPYGGGECPILN